MTKPKGTAERRAPNTTDGYKEIDSDVHMMSRRLISPGRSSRNRRAIAAAVITAFRLRLAVTTGYATPPYHAHPPAYSPRQARTCFQDQIRCQADDGGFAMADIVRVTYLRHRFGNTEAVLAVCAGRLAILRPPRTILTVAGL